MSLRNDLPTSLTYALLGALVIGSLLLPDGRTLPASAATPIDHEHLTRLELTGTVRDFGPWSKPGGHVDFAIHERDNPMGCDGRIWCGNIAAALGADRKPVFTGAGFAMARQFNDSAGRPICSTLFDPSLGDRAGAKACPSTGGIDSPASFDQWFRDAAEVNMAKPITVRFTRRPNGQYVFDDAQDPTYRDRGGFYPIDGELLDAPPRGSGARHNRHFTFELHAQFRYDASRRQVVQLTGNDDIWVFINDQLVVDLGGIHGPQQQHVAVDRLGLDDGATYPLDIFHAHRSGIAPSFRIVTTFKLEPARD